MKQKIKEILKGEYLSTFIIVGFVQMLGMALNYGVNIALANQFSVKGFGIWSLSFQTVILVYLAFSLVGNSQFVLRETVKNIAAQKWSAISSTLKRSIGLSTSALIIGAIVLFLGADVWYKGNAPSGFFLISLISYGVFLTFGRLRQAYQQATGQNRYSQIPERVVQPIIFGVLMFAIYNWGSWEITEAIWVYALASFIALIGSLFFIKPISRLRKENEGKDPVELKRKKVTRSYFLLIAVVDIIDSSVDLYLIQSLGYEEVAFYSVTKRIASLLQMVLVASGYTFLPLLNQHFIKDDKSFLQKRIYKINILNIAIASTLMLLLLFAKDILLGLFKEEYVSGVSWSLYFLALFAQWINIAFGMPGALLNVSGNEKYMFYTFSIAILLQFGFGSWLIPIYGMEGMAWIYVCNTFFWNITMAVIARKKTGLKSSLIT